MARVEFKFTGVKEANAFMEAAYEKAPEAMVAILTEAGLFGVRETKMETRVDTGRARASIGIFARSDLTSKATPEDATAAEAAAYYEPPTTSNLEVTWGSRVVYVPVLNYRLGDLMFEKGLQATISFLPDLCEQYLGDLFS